LREGKGGGWNNPELWNMINETLALVRDQNSNSKNKTSYKKFLNVCTRDDTLKETPRTDDLHDSATAVDPSYSQHSLQQEFRTCGP
jgi:hypothetical protein